MQVFSIMVKRCPETLAATALGHDDKATGAIVPPMHLSTAYLHDEDNQYRRGRMYAWADDPTFDASADTLTAQCWEATVSHDIQCAVGNAAAISPLATVLPQPSCATAYLRNSSRSR
jgi:O-acetylhomoserine/O-acetylserine sulfhydrylase-like pyridoxal-dependent enzyme